MLTKAAARSRSLGQLLPLVAIAVGLLSNPPAQAQPMFQNVKLSPAFSPNPMEIQGISGGSTPANQVAGRSDTPTGSCVGFVTDQPGHTLVLTAFFNYLNLQVRSPHDTTLVIQGPGGTWCNDDFYGKNPGISGQWLPGTYKVWVGSYEKKQLHPYVIRLNKVQ